MVEMMGALSVVLMVAQMADETVVLTVDKKVDERAEM